jgi:hypothetical protein
MKLQKLGGYAAVLSVVCGTGMNWFYFFQNDLMINPMKQHLFFILMIVWSIFLLITFLVLHERWKTRMPALMLIMLIAGSTGAVLQITCRIILIGSIGLSNEYIPVFERIVSGFHSSAIVAIAWADLFIGCAILRSREFSRVLGWMFIVSGLWWISGHFIKPPPQSEQILKALDHLLFGVCIFWIGIAMIRQKQQEPAATAIATAAE